MAVSVASGTPCLGTFRAGEQGRVLVYMAEDADAVVRERLVSLCRHHGIRLDALDLFVIVADTLRIDLPCEQQRLREAIARLRPRMLLLDPLVDSLTGAEKMLDQMLDLQSEFLPSFS